MEFAVGSIVYSFGVPGWVLGMNTVLAAGFLVMFLFLVWPCFQLVDERQIEEPGEDEMALNAGGYYPYAEEVPPPSYPSLEEENEGNEEIEESEEMNTLLSK